MVRRPSDLRKSEPSKMFELSKSSFLKSLHKQDKEFEANKDNKGNEISLTMQGFDAEAARSEL